MKFSFLTRISLLVLIIFSSHCLLAQAQDSAREKEQLAMASNGNKAPSDLGPDQILPPLREIKNNAFDVGEYLEFKIRYGPIVAGNSSMAVTEEIIHNGHPTLHIQTKAWTNSFFTRFFKVEDVVHSYIDKRGIFSWKFEKYLREGSYKSDKVFIYDQYNNLAYTPDDTLEVEPFVQDVLSALYYIRTQTFDVGDTLKVENQADSDVYPLNVIIHKREKVNVPAGKFNCIVVEPVLRGEGIFKAKGRIIVHLTDDQRKIPVLMTSKIYIKAFSLGGIVAELEKIEGVPGY